MPSILSDLYFGRCRPFERPCSESLQHQIDQVCAAQTAFEAKLTAELRAEFGAYLSECAKLSALSEEAEFAEGFRLGVRLMAASLGGK